MESHDAAIRFEPAGPPLPKSSCCRPPSFPASPRLPGSMSLIPFHALCRPGQTRRFSRICLNFPASIRALSAYPCEKKTNSMRRIKPYRQLAPDVLPLSSFTSGIRRPGHQTEFQILSNRGSCRRNRAAADRPPPFRWFVRSAGDAVAEPSTVLGSARARMVGSGCLLNSISR